MKITLHSVDKGTRTFLEREALANTTRRQSLDDLAYIDFNENTLTLVDPAPNGRITELNDALRSLYGKTIVNFTGISNTDLKLTYGAPNLPLLTEYDQNYSTLTKTLYDLGLELLSADYRDVAISTLEYAISIGTDISGNYITLANIYVENEQYDKITNLIACAEKINSLTKSSTITKLTNILDTHTTMVVAHPVDLPYMDYTAPIANDTISLSPSDENPDNILPKDILDILDFVSDTAGDQKP